jgi:hypothetical protein
MQASQLGPIQAQPASGSSGSAYGNPAAQVLGSGSAQAQSQSYHHHQLPSGAQTACVAAAQVGRPPNPQLYDALHEYQGMMGCEDHFTVDPDDLCTKCARKYHVRLG